MVDDRHDARGPSAGRGPDDRLDSLKEIAAYLRRDTRTVLRWRKDGGLPVHSHPHLKRGSVYAFKSELDAWWDRQRQNDAPEEGPQDRRLEVHWAGLMMLAVAVALGGGLFIGSQLRSGDSRTAVPLAFEEPDWVLVTAFENRTGEELFDGAIEAALERELSNSRFTYVVPRPRVDEALRLMKRPTDSRVDDTLGREVALRDGDISALISGRVDRLGSVYVLNAHVIDPVEGQMLASHEVEANGEEHVLPAVRRLSQWVRETLGETLARIQTSDQQLEKVTTPSLTALRLYTEAVALGDRAQWAAAEPLIRQVLAEDPNFAAAHMWLGYAVMRTDPANALPHFARAAELASTTTDRERYFILGSYHNKQGNTEKALAAYEALLQLHPDHYWGSNNLATMYSRLGRLQDAARVRMGYAKLRPHDLGANYGAAVWAVYGGSPDAAPSFIDRVQTLENMNAGNWRWPVRSWIELLPAHQYWASGNLVAAYTHVERVADTFTPSSELEAEFFACQVGTFYLTFGQLDEAEQWFRRATGRVSWCVGLAGSVEMTRGDSADLVQRIDYFRASQPKRLRSILLDGSWLLTQTHSLEAAQDLVHTLDSEGFDPSQRPLINGYLALAEGRPAEAVKLLAQGFNYSTPARALMGLESLADAWAGVGNLHRAVQVLEDPPFTAQQAYCTCGSAGSFWMRTRWRLAQLYWSVGRTDDARTIEDELRHQLQFADPDHPIRLGLDHLERQTTSAH